MKELSDGEMQWADGMLYPVLHRLEKEGLIESGHWVSVGAFLNGAAVSTKTYVLIQLAVVGMVIGVGLAVASRVRGRGWLFRCADRGPSLSRAVQ